MPYSDRDRIYRWVSCQSGLVCGGVMWRYYKVYWLQLVKIKRSIVVSRSRCVVKQGVSRLSRVCCAVRWSWAGVCSLYQLGEGYVKCYGEEWILCD